MIYKITKPAHLNTKDVTVFYFDDPYVFISERREGDDPEHSLEQYVPSNEQAEKWLADYQKFCEQTGAPQNALAITALTDPSAHKDNMLTKVANESSSFEVNLNKDMYFTSSLGFKVNGDRRTKDNLQDLVTFFDAQAVDGKIDYRDYENVTHKLTKVQVQTLLLEHVGNGHNLYSQKWQKQQAINDAQTFDELHAIDLGFSMMEFDPPEVSE